jgi:hypothetical protein
MTEQIKENINNPEKLERLYRDDKSSFEAGFKKIYSEIENSDIAKFWKYRLDYDRVTGDLIKYSGPDVIIMIAICLLAGFLIKIPGLFNINLTHFFFYEKNAGIIVFLGLTIYTTWKSRFFDSRKLLITLAAFLISIVYINLLPSIKNSDSIRLAYIHLPLLLWCIYGLIYTGFNLRDRSKLFEYLRYNGDLAIQIALILITGGILTVITIGLFNAIGIDIKNFYFDNIVMVGLVAVPVVATFIIKNHTSITNKIAPVISNIFSPLVLATAIIYLIAIAFKGKDPYNDRDFLLIFNIMLIGVVAIVVFSISETSIGRRQKFNELVLICLSFITLIIDLVALSAIFYRLKEFGMTPNRLAVLGSNILIFCNLILILIDLFKINFRKSEIWKVEITITKYLPVYIIWAMIVVFGFPFIFGMK